MIDKSSVKLHLSNMPIRVLSKFQASRIAAGEVIERPSSVVKELVENSIDAGANRITVSIKKGGIDHIAVTDNGIGIDSASLPLAIQRFATSKIDDSSDLTGIDTFGFRGEALPSIASVANLEIITCAEGESSGGRCFVSFGTAPIVEPMGAAVGTTVNVTDIFQNVPARLKFLSSPNAEARRINQILANFALIMPDIAFTFISDGKKRISSPGNGERLSATIAVYGQQVARELIEIKPAVDAVLDVEGLISPPHLSKGTREYITLSVNRRWVKNRRIIFGIHEAYKGYLQERSHPIVILNIRAPFEEVDVNVHPSKNEVRFVREDLVFFLTQRSIRQALSKSSPIRSIQTTKLTPSALSIPPRSQRPQQSWNPTWPEPDKQYEDRGQRQQEGEENVKPVELSSIPGQDETNSVDEKRSGNSFSTHRIVLPILRVVGQVRETYIVAEGPDGIYLIDQHAAHERVIYEDLTKRFNEGNAETQMLMEPEIVDMPKQHGELLQEHCEELSQAGFKCELFGESAVLIRTVPSIIAKSTSKSLAEIIRELLDVIAYDESATSWREKIIASMACHGSVRAGDILSQEEGRAIIRKLEQCTQPHSCPHGRPTMLHISGNVLERNFGRT